MVTFTFTGTLYYSDINKILKDKIHMVKLYIAHKYKLVHKHVDYINNLNGKDIITFSSPLFKDCPKLINDWNLTGIFTSSAPDDRPKRADQKWVRQRADFPKVRRINRAIHVKIPVWQPNSESMQILEKI